MPRGSETGYTVEDLERWISKANENIGRFEEAIRREQHQIAWAETIIADLKKRAGTETADGVPG